MTRRRKRKTYVNPQHFLDLLALPVEAVLRWLKARKRKGNK